MNQKNEDRIIMQNLHTHSIYDDGKDPIEDTVRTAIKKGFTVLGFSGHSFNPLDDGSMTPEKTEKYRQDVLAAKKKYQDQIEIVLGIEKDSLSDIEKDQYSYVIGSLHYLEKGGKFYPVDYSKEEFERLLEEAFQGDIQQMVSEYGRQQREMIEKGGFEILGHIDLITKYNEEEEYFAFDAPWYLAEMEKTVDAAIRKNLIIEMNTGAISRGYRSSAYPSDDILRMIQKKGGKICVNTDTHDRNNLDCALPETIRRAARAGFSELVSWQKGKFILKPIECFVLQENTEQH